MSEKVHCHLKTELDGKISDYVRSQNPKYASWDDNVVAAKIQFYNQYHEGSELDLDSESIESIAKKLMDYEEAQRRDRYNGIYPSRDNIYQDVARTIKTLKSRLSYKKRAEAVEYIAYLFSRKVDTICKDKSVPREWVINGYEKNGAYFYGEFAVFELIFNDLQVRIHALSNKESLSEEEEDMLSNYIDLNNNWISLAVYARVKLSQSEGLKLGQFRSYAKVLSGIEEAELALEDDSEEWVKDPADRIKEEQIPSFKRLGQITRYLLSQIPAYQRTTVDGERVYNYDSFSQPIPIVSSYGIPKTVNIKAAHRLIAELTIYCTTKEEFLDRLIEASKNILELKPLVGMLTAHQDFYDAEGQKKLSPEEFNRSKTADRYLSYMFMDYNNVWQSFAKVQQEKAKSISGKKGKYRLMKSLILNVEQNKVILKYNRLIKGHRGGSTAIYDIKGHIREDQMKSLIRNLEFFRNNDGKFQIQSGQLGQAVDRLLSIATALGVPDIDRSIIRQAIKKPVNRNKLMNSLRYVYDNNISYYIKNEGARYGEPLSIRDAEDLVPFDKIYNYIPTQKDDPTVRTSNKSHMQKLGEMFCKYVSTYSLEHKSTLESQVRTKNAKGDSITISSIINPGYLTQFAKDLKAFAENEDTVGLKNYLISKFGHNKAFVDIDQLKKDIEEGKNKTSAFRLRWLNDLYSADFSNVWSFINKVDVIRGLGNSSTGNPFENFSSKAHLEWILVDYMQEKRNSNEEAKLARWPVFISGDANQYKTIVAPIYNPATIIEDLVDIFYFERELQSELKGMKEFMRGKGYKELSARDEEYCLMPAFNKIFEGKDVSRLSRVEIRNLIKDHFDIGGEAFKSFKDTCVKLGIVVDLGDGKYRVSNSIADATNTKKSAKQFLYEFWLNYKYAMVNQMSIMTVSPAFYKGIKDLQKRYKETHSSGQKLDLDVRDDDGKRVFDKKATLRAIYLEDAILNCEDFDPRFMEAIKKGNPEVYKAYTEINTTDGQAFRTIESYRKVALGIGKWTVEMEEFYKELQKIRQRHIKKDGSIDFDAITDNEVKSLLKYGVIFQPLKPFLFTHEKIPFRQDGTEEGINPTQIKCSEAVLIPELMYKDSRMRHLAEYMTQNNIDVAAFESCVKVGCWGQTNINEANSREELFEALSEEHCKVHELSYRDYLIQNNVPPHEYQERLFATQIRKLIMGGKYDSVVDYFGGKIPRMCKSNGETYVPSSMNRYEMLHFYNELLMANFTGSLKEFLDDVGSEEKISNFLIKSILNNDRNSVDLATGLILDIESGKFDIPLCEAIQEHDIVNNLLAAFKQTVNKQRILGGSGVQVSSYGIQDYKESENLHIVDGKDGMYAEVIIPLVHKYTDKYGNEREVDYDTYCNPDGSLVTDENGQYKIDIHFPGIRDFVAYRIPTERAYSMINCKAVRFTRPTQGITIQVPSQCVKISGFDFDIDKLYFMFKNIHLDKKGKVIEYDFNKTVNENPKFARDNMLLEIIRHRLMDPNTFKERTTPGGYTNASEATKNIMQLLYNKEAFAGRKDLTLEDIKQVRDETGDKDFEPDYDYTDVETMLILNQRNQLAAKLIGIFANQNANHVYCAGLSQLTVNTPIAFGQYAEEGLSDLIHAPEGVDTYLALAELLAASVDAVKDPILGYLNLNTLTASAACMLGRLGYDFFDIGLLLNQPVIKYVCEQALERDISLSYAINEFIGSIEGKNAAEIEASSPTRSELIYNLVNKNENNIQEDGQIGILRLFENILAASNELNTLVSKTRYTAANAIKPSFGNLYSSMSEVDKLENFTHITVVTSGLQKAPIINNGVIDLNNLQNYFGSLSSNPMAFEQCMYDCMVTAMNKLLDYFPYNTNLYSKARSLFSYYSRYGNLSEKTIDMIHKELPVFILSAMENSEFRYDICQSALEHFPKELSKFLEDNPELANLPIFENLIIGEDKETHKVTVTMDFSTSIDDKIDKDAIIDSWESLMKTPKGRNIAFQLFLYNFARTGFGFTASSFIHYAPTELKKKMKVFVGGTYGTMTYADFWYSLMGKGTPIGLTSEQLVEFFKLFILNHIENKEFVTSIYGGTAEVLEPLFTSNKEFKDEYDESIMISKSDFKDKEALFDNIAKPVFDENERLVGYIYAPCISFYDTNNHTKVYYMLENMGGPVTHAVYRRVYPIGETNKSLHYADSYERISEYSEEEYENDSEGENSDPAEPSSFRNSEDNTMGVGNRTPSSDQIMDSLVDNAATLATILATKGKDVSIEEEEGTKALILDGLKAADLTKLSSFINDLKQRVGSNASAREQKLIKDILEKAAKTKLIVLDEEGNPNESCKTVNK